MNLTIKNIIIKTQKNEYFKPERFNRNGCFKNVISYDTRLWLRKE